MFAEPWRGHDYYDEDVRQAEQALAQAVESRLFSAERQGEFDFWTYASSIGELRDFIAAESAYEGSPTDGAEVSADAERYARFEQVWQAAGEGAEVARHERGRITRLTPLKREADQ